jgi:hypothetical protein
MTISAVKPFEALSVIVIPVSSSKLTLAFLRRMFLCDQNFIVNALVRIWTFELISTSAYYTKP